MLIIRFKKFTKEFIKDLTDNWDIDDNWNFYLQESSMCTPCPLNISINNKRVTLPAISTHGYIIPDTLMNLNNALCFLLQKGEATAVFNRPDFLEMKIKEDQISFTNKKIRRPDLQAVLIDEPSDLEQAIKEMIKAKCEYKKICLEAAKLIKPKEIESFMNVMLLEKGPNMEDAKKEETLPYWLDLEEAWEEYKKKTE